MEKASNYTNTAKKTEDSPLGSSELHAIFRTSKKIIQEYSREIERYNRYRTARADMSIGTIMDNRGPLIDLYESCIQQDAHIKGVIETLESQVLGERYMLAAQNKDGKYIKHIEATKKIQGTQFIKIIKGILESVLFGYTLIELGEGVDETTGRLNDVHIIERRNVLPDQNYVVKRQGQFSPGWNISSRAYKNNYILINNGDLGLFSATTPLILAKKFTFANYVGFAQTYGQPIIQGKTQDDGTEAKQRMADDIANCANNRIVVTGLEDELTIHAMAMSNSEKIFTGIIDMGNNEVSNLILGSGTMAGDTQSYVGSTSAHQDIFRDRIEVYREYIENVMNEEIIPRLISRGFLPNGVEFKYSNKIEMSNADRIALFKVLTEKYDIAPDEIEKEFGVVVEKIKAIEEKVSPEKGVAANFLTGELL